MLCPTWAAACVFRSGSPADRAISDPSGRWRDGGFARTVPFIHYGSFLPLPSPCLVQAEPGLGELLLLGPALLSGCFEFREGETFGLLLFFGF